MGSPILYFAYGSNLNADDLRTWCQEKEIEPVALNPVGPATLPDYELCVGRWSRTRDGGVLDVRPARGFEVPGVLFTVTDDMLRIIDRKEGTPRAYRRVDITLGMAAGLRSRRDRRLRRLPGPCHARVGLSAERRTGRLGMTRSRPF